MFSRNNDDKNKGSSKHIPGLSGLTSDLPSVDVPKVPLINDLSLPSLIGNPRSNNQSHDADTGAGSSSNTSAVLPVVSEVVSSAVASTEGVPAGIIAGAYQVAETASSLFPKFTSGGLPKIPVVDALPKLPKVDIPKLPTGDIPKLPLADALPEVNLPGLPFVGVPKLPESLPKVPDVISKLPDAVPKLPDVLPHVTAALPKLPDALPKLPDALPKFPDALPKLPDVLPDIVEGLPKFPNASPNIPEALPKLLDTLPKVPNVLSDISGALPKLPDALPKLPDSLPNVIDSLPKLPDTLPKLPDAIPKLPDDLPKLPDGLPKLPLGDGLANLRNIPRLSHLPNIIPTLPGVPRLGDLINEGTPLLHTAKKRVPWNQVFILLFAQAVEPLAMNVFLPFTPGLMRKALGDDIGSDDQLLYAARLLDSLVFFVQAATVLFWSRTSDKIGRKPVLLIGLVGTFLSMICLGLYQSFWGAIASRLFMIGLNGNSAVIRNMMAEMVEVADLPRIYAFAPLAYTVGVSVAYLIKDYLQSAPILLALSSFIPIALSFIALTAVFLSLQETVKTPFALSTVFKFKTPLASFSTQEHAANSGNLIPGLPIPIRAPQLSDGVALVHGGVGVVRDGIALGENVTSNVTSRIPFISMFNPFFWIRALRALLASPVFIATANFGCLVLIDVIFYSVQTHFLASPTSAGGLGLGPSEAEKTLCGFGMLNGCVQLMFFAKTYASRGPKKTFVNGAQAAVPLFLSFYVASFLSKSTGPGILVWAIIGVQVVFWITFNFAFGAVFMYITSSSPTPEAIGATNGLALMVANTIRGAAPWIATGLFSSVAGSSIYIVSALIAAVATTAAWFLPKKLWTRGLRLLLI